MALYEAEYARVPGAPRPAHFGCRASGPARQGAHRNPLTIAVGSQPLSQVVDQKAVIEDGRRQVEQREKAARRASHEITDAALLRAFPKNAMTGPSLEHNPISGNRLSDKLCDNTKG